MLSTRDEQPYIPQGVEPSSPPLRDLLALSLEQRSKLILAHGSMDLARSVCSLEHDGLPVPKGLQERIAWAVAWNIGIDAPESSQSTTPRRVRGYCHQWPLETAWKEVWRSLTKPSKSGNPGPDRVLLDELALSVLCEQRETWQPAASRPLDPGPANAAFEFIYKRNNDKVIGHLRRRFGDRAGEPEVIAGEAWARVYCDYWSTEARRRFLGLCHISTLVCQVAQYVAIDILRDHAGRVSWEEPESDDGDKSGTSLSEQIGVEVDPGEQVMMEQLRQRLDECMQALSPRQQLVAELIWLQEQSAKAVAEQLGVSEPAISQHAKKARESVRGCLERHGYRMIC